MSNASFAQVQSFWSQASAMQTPRPNRAIDSDTYSAPLRTPIGARHRGRQASREEPMGLDPAPRRELHWSHKEKSVARAAFDSALARENASVRKEVERMLESSKEASAVWEVLEFLSNKQREIERKYDYRYSILTGVFARLLYEGWITEKDLSGLSPEKLELIRRGAGTVRELDA